MTILRYFVVLCLFGCPAAAVAGQLTVLKSFSSASGRNPKGSVLLDNGVLYGTNSTLGPGTAGNDPSGNVFRINTDGTGYQILKQFAHHSSPDGPSGSMVLDGNTLYATAGVVGAVNTDIGSVFAVDTDGGGFHFVHSFDGSGDAVWPISGVIRDGTTLYGTTSFGVPLFKVNMDGNSYQSFATLPTTSGSLGGVALVGSVLYGVNSFDGSNNLGFIYKVQTDGTGYSVLHDFSGGALDGSTPLYLTLVSDGISLYGTTQKGGSANLGTVFKMDPDGLNFQLLHSFSGADGSSPRTGLTLVGSTLYGVTGGKLTIFRINTNGTGFESLYQEVAVGGTALFDPDAPLTPGGPNLFYGTTNFGGASFSGTVFEFIVPEPSGLALLAMGLASLMAIVRRRGRLIARSV